MEVATFIGISINEFWDITPLELRIAIKGYQQRKEDEYKQYQLQIKTQQKLMTIQAYELSRWVWAKKINIQQILKEIDKDSVEQSDMTDEQMFEQIKSLNAMFGGVVISDGSKK